MRTRKITSLALVVAMSLSLVACGKEKNPVALLRTENMITKEQAISMYTNGNNNIFKINVEANNIEIIPIDESTELHEKLVDISNEVIAELSMSNYDKTSKYITHEQFDYVKSNLDMYRVNNVNIRRIGRNSEYYVVDLGIQAENRGKTEFKESINSIAIDGIFEEIGGERVPNEDYMDIIAERLNDYYIDEGIDKRAIVDFGNIVIRIFDAYSDEYGNVMVDAGKYGTLIQTESGSWVSSETGAGASFETGNTEENYSEYTETNTENTEVSTGETVDNNVEENNDTDGSVESEAETGTETETETVEETTTVVETNNNNANEVTEQEGPKEVAEVRKLDTDLGEIIKVVGFSKVEKAKFPGLEYIINVDSTNSNMGGYGISGDGANGLLSKGYECKGADLELRIILSNKTNDLNDIEVKNLYFKSISEDSTIATTEQSTIPSDVQQIIDDTIERMDCCHRDKDYCSMMKCGLVDDIGYAIWIGYVGSCTYIDSYDSEIKNIAYRDINNNEYVLNVSSYVREGAKGCGSTGRYIDSYLYCIKIEKGVAVVTDIKRIGRTVVSEPTLDEVGYAYKKLLGYESYKALSDDTKNEVKKTMDDWYNACTMRLLRGPKTVESNGQQITIEKGMYDVFNKDTSIISEAEVEAVNSYIRNILVYKGVDVGCKYSGNITEWVGGGDNQVEFISEEVFAYNGVREAVYEKVYYNLSRYGETGEWVIDERRIIESNRYKDEEYDKLASKLSNQ